MPTASSFRSKFSGANDTAKLQKKAQELKQGGSFQKDERFWSPTIDKSGVGYAKIRFLPQVDGEELPWVQIWEHAFKGPSGQWYWENCPTTIGQPCPCCQANSALWATELKSNQDIVRKRKRKLSYISNIFVISDPGRPDAEGKVFLYKYGKTIFDKINEKMNPTFKSDEVVNPFDFWEGCDFILKAKTVDDYLTYEPSEWSSKHPLSDNDKQLEAIWALQHKLGEFVAPDKFKPFSVLQARLDVVLGSSGVPATGTDTQNETYSPTVLAPSRKNQPADGGEPPFDTTPEAQERVAQAIANATTKKPVASGPAKNPSSNLERLRKMAEASEE